MAAAPSRLTKTAFYDARARETNPELIFVARLPVLPRMYLRLPIHCPVLDRRPDEAARWTPIEKIDLSSRSDRRAVIANAKL
jgi:hypothetical protein